MRARGADGGGCVLLAAAPLERDTHTHIIPLTTPTHPPTQPSPTQELNIQDLPPRLPLSRNPWLGDLPGWVSLDPDRWFLTGFSNGAGMVFRYAASEPRRFRAVAPVAGHCWVNPTGLGLIPTLYVIGEDDPILPLQGGVARTPWGKLSNRPPVAETLQRWAAGIGIPPHSPGFQVQFLANHGHHWPGGQAKLGPRLGGPISTELNANEAIWRFFSQTVR